MPGRLFTFFERFWEYATEETAQRRVKGPVLLRVAENWRRWREAKLTGSEKHELDGILHTADAVEQEEFLRLIEGFCQSNFPTHASESQWLIVQQLSGLKEFYPWRGTLLPYCWGAPGIVQFVTLGPSRSRVGGAVRPIRVLFLPDQGTTWDFVSLGVQLGEGHLDRVRRAVTSLLGGWSFWVFMLLWASRGWTYRQSWARGIAVILFISALGELLTVVFLDSFPREAMTLLPWATLATSVSLFLLATGVLLREWCHVGSKRRLLRGKSAVIVVGTDPPGQRLDIQEGSFGLALYIATLLEVFGDAPDPSALGWCLGRFPDPLREMAFTGEVRRLGTPGQVDCVGEKVAICATRGVPTLFLPKRGSRKERKAHKTSRIPRLRGLPQLVPMPLSLSPVRGLRPWGTSVAVAVAVVMLSMASFDAWGILRPVESPDVDAGQTGVYRRLDSSQDELHVSFESISESGLGARLSSTYWANREQEIQADPSGRALVRIPLNRLPRSSTEDPYDGELQVVQRRSFLWRTLLPRIVRVDALRALILPNPHSR